MHVGLVSALHRFYLFIVITVCYPLRRCFRFTHLDPLTAVRSYSTWVGTYLEEDPFVECETCFRSSSESALLQSDACYSSYRRRRSRIDFFQTQCTTALAISAAFRCRLRFKSCFRVRCVALCRTLRCVGSDTFRLHSLTLARRWKSKCFYLLLSPWSDSLSAGLSHAAPRKKRLNGSRSSLGWRLLQTHVLYYTNPQNSYSRCVALGIKRSYNCAYFIYLRLRLTTSRY